MPSPHDGLPDVAMESIALGKPVIASNVNGVSELIDHRKTGYILPSLSIETISNAIKFAIDNHGSKEIQNWGVAACLLYTSPSPRDLSTSRMPSSA